MTPEDITKIYNTLAATVPTTANQATQAIGAAEALKAPGLATIANQAGGQGIGAYNYARLIPGPVATIRDSIISQGLSDALTSALYSAVNDANVNYEGAQRSYRERLRARQKEQALENERRQRALYAAQLNSYNRSSPSTPAASSGGTIGGVRVNPIQSVAEAAGDIANQVFDIDTSKGLQLDLSKPNLGLDGVWFGSPFSDIDTSSDKNLNIDSVNGIPGLSY